MDIVIDPITLLAKLVFIAGIVMLCFGMYIWAIGCLAYSLVIYFVYNWRTGP